MQTPRRHSDRDVLSVAALLLVTVAFLLAGVVLDISKPFSGLGSIAYVLAIFCTLWFRHHYAPFVLAAISVALIVMGYYQSPETLMIRTVSILAICVSVLLVGLQNSRLIRLRENKDFLDMMVESLPTMIFLKDAKDLKFVLFNQAGEDLIGVPRDEMIGKNDYDFFPKEQADFFTLKDREVFSKGEVEEILEEPIETKNKGKRWLHTKKFPILDKNQEPLYLLGISNDITEQKEYKERMAQSEQQFRSAMQYSRIGMALVAPDGKWLEVNKALCDIVGYTREELLEVDFQTLTHADDLDADLAYVEQMINREIDSYEMEKRYIHKDGHIVWVLLSVSLVWGQDGQPEHFISQIQDITKRKQAEAQEKERQKMESLGRMAGGVAHEINNFLQPIFLMAEVIHENRDLSEEVKEQLKLIIDNTAYASNVVQDVLTFSRAGVIEPRQDRAFKGLFHTAVTFVQTLLPGTVEVNVEEPEELPYTCRMGEQELMQVLTNLLLNASYAMDHRGTITISVLVREVAGDEVTDLAAGSYAVIRVKDQGTGIPETVRDKIFEPFFTTKEVGEGTGLGLSVVFGILQECDGKIILEETSPDGTTFAIYIPVLEGEVITALEASG